MLRNMTKTVGSAIAALCLVSTLAMAQTQYPSQTQHPTQREQSQAQPPLPSQPMTSQTGNTTPQQSHRQDPNPMLLTCSKDNGKGICVAARGSDGKEFVVNGEGVKSGATMTCVDRGSVVDCKPAS